MTKRAQGGRASCRVISRRFPSFVTAAVAAAAGDFEREDSTGMCRARGICDLQCGEVAQTLTDIYVHSHRRTNVHTHTGTHTRTHAHTHTSPPSIIQLIAPLSALTGNVDTERPCCVLKMLSQPLVGVAVASPTIQHTAGSTG